MTARRRAHALLAIFACASAPAAGCDIAYPADYVAPTHEELISKSQAAFVGHVIGYRLDDGSIIERDFDCSHLAENWDSCWAKRGTIVSAILSVDIGIRGMGQQKLFEDERSAEPGADCGNYYADDTVFWSPVSGPSHWTTYPARLPSRNGRRCRPKECCCDDARNIRLDLAGPVRAGLWL